MIKSTQTEAFSIPGKYSVKEAAGLLGVSTTRVIQLVHSGEIKACKTVSDAFLIDAKALQTYQRIRVGKGRPWKTETAWAALWLLSGKPVDWLEYHQLRRLSIRLKSISEKELVWLSRRRAYSKTFRASSSFVEALKSELVLSGGSTILISAMGLTKRNDIVEGYLAEQDYELVKEKYHLVEDTDGNVVIHLVANPPFNLSCISQIPEAVVLVDMAESADTRERTVALSRLKELLHGQS